MYRSLFRSLVLYGSIRTTQAKAKFLQGYAENIVNFAKAGSLATRRIVNARLGNDRKTADAVFSRILPSVKLRNGGYTRVVLMPPRRGDSADMAKIEWVDKIVEDKKKENKSDKSEVDSKTNRKSATKEEDKNKVSPKGLRRLMEKVDKKNYPRKSAIK